MDIQHPHQFVLHGEALLDTFWLPVAIAGNRPKWGAGIIRCTLSAQPNKDAQQPLADWMKGDWLFRPIQLRGVISYRKDFWIPKFQLKSFSADASGILKWEGIATRLIEGELEKADEVSEKIRCSVFISRTPLTEHMRYANSNYKEVSWNSTSSKMVLKTEMHDFTKEGRETQFHIFHTKASRDSIQITCQAPMSLRSFVENLDDLLDESLLLLSLLSRERVVWYTAEVDCRLAQPGQRSPHADLYRGDISVETEGISSAHKHSLRVNRIDEQAIAEGLFHKLFAEYQGSPFGHVIRRTIPHLLTSYKEGYLEGRLGSAYLALESLVDGLSEGAQISYLLNASQFKKLSKKLRMAIQEEVDDQNTALGIINKLTELRRRAFLDRLMILIREHDLLAWMQEDHPYYLPRYHSLEDIQALLHDILKRRNIHIHQGKMEDEHHTDLPFLQEIIELWILKLLGCPGTAIEARLYGTFWRHVDEK
jgi:hypothetical protein